MKMVLTVTTVKNVVELVNSVPIGFCKHLYWTKLHFASCAFFLFSIMFFTVFCLYSYLKLRIWVFWDVMLCCQVSVQWQLEGMQRHQVSRNYSTLEDEGHCIPSERWQTLPATQLNCPQHNCVNTKSNSHSKTSLRSNFENSFLNKT